MREGIGSLERARLLEGRGFRNMRDHRCNARPAHGSFWKHTGLGGPAAQLFFQWEEE